MITDQFEPGANADIEHIALASTIDLLLIAPATANIIGKLANGIADDFLSTLYTATRAPRAARAGDEHADVRARGGAAESRHARGARRALRRAGRGLSGVRLDRQRPARRARRDRRRGRGDRCGPTGRCAAGACWSPPVRPTRISIPFATSATARAAGWVSRLPPRRRAAARDVTLVTGPTVARCRRPCAKWCACAAPRRCTRR